MILQSCKERQAEEQISEKKTTDKPPNFILEWKLEMSDQ